MSLGDAFPEANRRDLFDREFTPGRIVRLYCYFTDPPKEKFLLLCSIDPAPVFLVINSEIRPFVQSKPWLLNCQAPISASEHSCLTHDSHVDCTKAITELSIEHAAAQAMADMSRLKEQISKPALDIVIKAVMATTGISPRVKNWILDGLRPLL